METMKDYACMKQKELIQIALSHLMQLKSILECLADSTDPVRPYDFFMTRKEAADFIGRTPKSVDRLVRERKLTRNYVDGCTRFRKSELLRYLGYDFNPEVDKPKSELDRIIRKVWGRKVTTRR